MTANGWFQIAVFVLAVLLVTKPLGLYLVAVYDGRVRWLAPVEGLVFRLAGVDPAEEQHWTRYAGGMLLFSAATMLLTYLVLRLQHYLPLNPQKLPGVIDRQAFETAASFTSNTDWQSYSGEATMSYMSQMTQLAFHNFVSAAVGMALAVALVRGIVRRSAGRLGSFWADLVRGTLYVLLPFSVSHDMRTPLASIEGAASTLLQNPEQVDAPTRRDLATTILQESQRMGRLVANLLDMIRLESGALQVHKEWQLLSDVVGVALLRTEDQLRQHTVTTRLPSDLPLVAVDEILLEQVFVNLLENAAKYTPPGTPVEIGAEARESEVVVWVADRGPGLPPGEEDRIFQKFYRAGGAPSAGVGLGLTICRGIVTAHGGRIWAENRAGGGAMFRFTIPIVGTAPTIDEETGSSVQALEIGTPWIDQPHSSS